MQALVLRLPQSLVEAVSDALIDELDAVSVSVEDADADTPAEQALFGEPDMPPPKPGWERSRLTAHFAEAGQAEAAGALLCAQDWAADLSVESIDEVPEQDWVRLTQSQFEPVAVTPTFWIVPSWHQPPAQATHVLRLDPGLAFGTGTHPTTRMCLRWLAAHQAALPGHGRVLDYGCGSGVLAIAAALLGAPVIDAVDIDPAALTATRDNAAANGVAGLQVGDPTLARGPYDLVLANILATPLKLLAPLLGGLLAPGAPLVLAGILARQTADLQAAYAPWVALQVADQEDGWVLLAGRRAR
jgi:ribosomal protein L11 methyltransferase